VRRRGKGSLRGILGRLIILRKGQRVHQVLGSSVGTMGRRVLLALATAVVLMLGWTTAAHAATFTVNTTTDTTSCTSSSCSLRGAISAANATTADDMIAVPAGTYRLTLTGVAPEDANATGDLDIGTTTGSSSGSLTIQGAGSGSTKIDASGLAPDTERAIKVLSGATATISGLTITGGNASIRTKAPSNEHNGGGIRTLGTLTVTDSTISGNQAFDAGGGIEDDGSLTVRNSTVSGNTASSGDGGGIRVLNPAMLNVSDSTISGNSSAANGGGVAVGGTATIARSTVSGNTSSAVGGGVGVTPTFGVFGIVDSQGALTLSNSTVTGNTATTNGGGVGNFGSSTLVSDTLTSNSAPTGANLSSEVVPGQTPGSVMTSFENTIVSSPQMGANCSNVTGSSLTSKGFDLEDDAAKSCGFTQSTDPPAADPKLGPLADNGGPTKTLALTAGSPAIDHGTVDGLAPAPLTDQRGVSRPIGPKADIGAFELALPTAVTGAASNITQSGATVAGTATDPNNVTGGQAFFQYGPASAPTSSQTASQPVAAGANAAAVTAALTGLMPGTVYHYRLVVTNPDGTSTGQDQTFTTAAPSDTTKPTIAINTPTDGASYRQGETVHANYSCMDELGGSGLKSCVGTVANGSPIDTSPSRTAASVTFPVTSRSFTVTATDNAGNTASKTVHYRVVGAAVQGPVAELGLSLRARPGRVHVGDRPAYTLTVTNHGPDRATGVVVRERLPGQVAFVSVRTSRGGSCTGRRIVLCRFSSLSARSSVRVVITVRAVHLGRARSTARVAGAQTDPVPGNNTSSATISVVPQPRPRFAG